MPDADEDKPLSGLCHPVVCCHVEMAGHGIRFEGAIELLEELPPANLGKHRYVL
jgi:hypothetical protein